MSRPARKPILGIQTGILALLTLLAFGQDANSATRNEVMQMISDEATRNGSVPVALALAVARIESNFNDCAISAAGARGVMQIMPSSLDTIDLMDPQTNIRLGVAFLEHLYHRYGQDWELALSHYNGGRLRNDGSRFVAHRYTRHYVAEVLRWSRFYQSDGTAMAFADASLSPESAPQRAWRGADLIPPGDWWQVRPAIVTD